MIPLLLDSLAAYRLTRLATADKLTAPMRDVLIHRAYSAVGRDLDDTGAPVVDWTEYALADEDAPKLAVLVTCRWCAGMWIALAVVAARRLFPRAWSPLAEGLAFSAGAALLAGLED